MKNLLILIILCLAFYSCENNSHQISNAEFQLCQKERRIYSQVIDNYFEELWHGSSDYIMCLFDACQRKLEKTYHKKYYGASAIWWDEKGFLCSANMDEEGENDYLLFVPAQEITQCEPFKMRLPWQTFKSYI